MNRLHNTDRNGENSKFLECGIKYCRSISELRAIQYRTTVKGYYVKHYVDCTIVTKKNKKEKLDYENTWPTFQLKLCRDEVLAIIWMV